MDNKVPDGMPDFSKAYSPRKAFKLTRVMYMTLLARVEALESLDKPEVQKKTRRTKAEIAAAKAKD